MTKTQSVHILTYEKQKGRYPNLSRAAAVLDPPPADIIGRDIGELSRGLRNPEKANVVLLAEPGSGKTAYVQAFAYDKAIMQDYLVLNVNPELLIDRDGDRDNALLVGFNALLDEASRYSKDQNVIVTLFVDEFHKLVEISPSLMESLKPRLEKSAMHGFRLITATTFQEYNQWVAPNQALDQRFIQIKLAELSKDAVLQILKNRAKEHGVEDLLDDGVLEDIYTETKRLLPSNAQPRVSLDVFHSMVGDAIKRDCMENGRLVKTYYTAEELGYPSKKVLSRMSLKKVIRRMSGIDIDNEVNALEVVDALKKRLYNQDHVIELVVRQLEMAFQGFGELDRPKFSFISTGATGVGKQIADDEWIPVWTPNGTISRKRNGDLVVGDFVFNRLGQPVKVLGVYPQGIKTVYEVELTDGRILRVGDGHLWTYKCRSGNGAKHWQVTNTETLMKKYEKKYVGKGRSAHSIKFVIPMNQAVQWPEQCYKTDPYVIGVAIGNGCLTDPAFTVSSEDAWTVEECGRLLGAVDIYKDPSSYSYSFYDKSKTDQKIGVKKKFYTREVLAEVPELINCKSGEKFIPEWYKYGSIFQRWSLIQGLFDTDGSIDRTTRYRLGYYTTAKQLAYDVQDLLYSLGFSSSITSHTRLGKSTEYRVLVKCNAEDKEQFFRLKRKRMIAREAVSFTSQKKRVKKFGEVIGIRDIRKVDEQVPMTCIMVDDPEHLYQAGQYVVTHNTELAKIISETMRLPLKRFDMSRYSDPKDANAFADDLFRAVWATPNAYLLIDEVEKSSKKAMNILLQVLDDARLTDSVNSDRVASFSGAIINLTTNLGSEVYRDMARHQAQDTEADVEVVYKSLCDSEVFETAVLGRLDAIVPFHPLPAEALEKIARRTLQTAIEGKETRERRIVVSDDVIPYIVKDRTSYDTERGGARDVKRNVKNLVIQELAHYLTYAKHEVPVLIYIKGRPRFKYKDVADPLNARVAIRECYPASTVKALLDKLSAKLGKPLVDLGLYLPTDRELKEYMQRIVKLSADGYHKFKSRVDGERTIIEGVSV